MALFTASDGGRIAYRDTGGTGRPLVLLHGLMAHGGFFREQAPLESTFRLITVDLRGHGDSKVATGTAALTRAAADVAELVAALDLRDAVGVGWSLGATVLWHVLTGPEADRFAGAVVVDMTARVRNGDDWTLGLSPDACAARTIAIRTDFESFAVNAGRAIFADADAPGSRAMADWAGGEFARNDPAAIADMWTSLEEDDARGRLSRIRQPTLIISGAHSGLYGAATAEHLASALPRAQLLRFDQSGHAPLLEEPERFNRAVSDFAASLPPVTQPEELKS